MEKKHSGFGIASFVLSLIVLFAELGVILVAGAMAAQAGGELDENTAQAQIIGLSILGLLAVSLVAIGLGIAGVTNSDRSKTFGILGLCISVGTFLLVCGLILIGISMK